MTKRMLIDATQPEETRVALVEGDRLDSYDFDSAIRKQIKGNIFLAKVTRVEPSLQACFVEYGGNRQGFLAFTEIHPDYYRIPVEDRQALLAEEAEMEEDEEEFDKDDVSRVSRGRDDQNFDDAAFDGADMAVDEFGADLDAPPSDFQLSSESNAIAAIAERDDSVKADAGFADEGDDATTLVDAPNLTEVERDNTIDRVGGEEESGSQSRNRRQGRLRKRYKIQEVIKRRQIMLVQATKEERGQKGAAMTTYISLPGRYCVLMPNSPRGGGVSRKITDQRARRKMKELLAELNVPAGMSIILRTAGITRSKTEIKRDFDYLLKLWDEVRRETMQSVAPAMIYEEADIFKRTIRDLYSRDTTEIIVAGEIGYKRVKTFMHQMVPAHAPRVKFYRDTRVPLFQSFGIEYQIADIFSPRVELKSGGYIVINPTEALVSIDVNSGRATRERNIDDTAFKTNMEAASEIARQLRLRDLGGLVVIDFIDMESNRHNAKVERRLREAMSSDRARIEIGRISGFGLMELSRQRLHPSLTETHFEQCHHCAGTGLVRTIDSAAVVAMRAIEAEAVKGRAIQIIANVPQQVAVYILNHKREEMNRIEDYFGCKVSLRVDETLQLNDMTIEAEKGTPTPRKQAEMLSVPFVEGVDDQPVVEDEPDEEISSDSDDGMGADDGEIRDRREEGDGQRRRNGAGQRSGEGSSQGSNQGSNQGSGRRSRGGRNRNRSRTPRPEGQEPVLDADGNIVDIPITEGALPEGAARSEQSSSETGDGNSRRGNSRNRRGGRHPYRRGRERRERSGEESAQDNHGEGDPGRSLSDTAEAPSSRSPAIMGEATAPRVKREDGAAKGANDSTDEKRAWWQKLIE